MIIYCHCTIETVACNWLSYFLLTCHPYIPFHFMKCMLCTCSHTPIDKATKKATDRSIHSLVCILYDNAQQSHTSRTVVPYNHTYFIILLVNLTNGSKDMQGAWRQVYTQTGRQQTVVFHILYQTHYTTDRVYYS